MIGKYKVAHLLGRTNGNEKRFRRVEVEMTKAGYICFVPAVYDFEIYKKNAEVLKTRTRLQALRLDLVTERALGIGEMVPWLNIRVEYNGIVELTNAAYYG